VSLRNEILTLEASSPLTNFSPVSPIAVTGSSLNERFSVTEVTWSERSTELTLTPTLLFRNTAIGYSSSFFDTVFGFGAICPTFSSQALSSEGTS
jgi:hypothetical protein